ncbi:MAG: hypothetical protein IKP78_04015 [Ruminococcus sp.]|nr:hypothetical protein [Ruminococcus sp.]
MTNIEKLVALFRKVSRLTDDYDGQSVDYAVGLKLGEMMKNGEEVLAAVTGDAVENTDGSFGMQLVIAPTSHGNFFMIFPDTETAAAVGTGYTMCRIAELIELVDRTPQMSGIQLVLSVDAETGRFGTGEINRPMVMFALEAAKA